MAKYNVSIAVDLRVNVEVEANSFAEAFEKAKSQVSVEEEYTGKRELENSDGNIYCCEVMSA